MTTQPAPGEHIPTKERLARALEELHDPDLAPMIEKARSGYYDDFESPLTYPLTGLVMDLRTFGHEDFVQRVIAGEFDSTLDEGIAWLETTEGQDALRQLAEKD